MTTALKTSQVRALATDLDAGAEGAAAHALAKALYPICRSITGEGVRKSLRLLRETVPLELRDVPTGTPVFDWTVPREWNIRDACIKDRQGKRVVDFHEHNLHVVNYSIPVRGTFSLEELRPHLHSLPEAPDRIPYRTSYYRENWGFCLRHRDLESLPEGPYEVLIDSTLQPGHLSYGEFLVKGRSEQEVLISCHSCHPSLANDNLSGMVAGARLARLLAPLSLRYSYRFLWIPGTIGAITWLARNEDALSRIRHGLVLSCLGDPGAFTYKRSRQGNAGIDRVVEQVLTISESRFQIAGFEPFGYDERQYCSPGINLPMGCLMRTPHGKYPEYHTSADDLSFIRPSALGQSIRLLLSVVAALEENQRYLNLNPKCEPQLGRRGLYRQTGGFKDATEREMALLWVLNLSDGEHDLLEIARRSGRSFDDICQAAADLIEAELLESVEETR